MSEANEKQIGGNHYKGSRIEHWDLMHPAYLLGCASKYVSRHKKKNGREDLEKAIHYCEKFQETHESWGWYVSNDALLDWAVESNMDLPDYTILHYMLCTKEMPKTIELIRKRIVECYSQPVPLTEENHYAERALSPEN